MLVNPVCSGCAVVRTDDATEPAPHPRAGLGQQRRHRLGRRRPAKREAVRGADDRAALPCAVLLHPGATYTRAVVVLR
jgi:hypothetical protein